MNTFNRFRVLSLIMGTTFIVLAVGCKKGNVHIYSEPAGAKILDKSKKEIAQTPFDTTLPNGKYVYSLVKENYASEIVRFEIGEKNKNFEIKVILKDLKTARNLVSYYTTGIWYLKNDVGWNYKIQFLDNGTYLYGGDFGSNFALRASPGNWAVKEGYLVLNFRFPDSSPKYKPFMFSLHEKKEDFFRARLKENEYLTINFTLARY